MKIPKQIILKTALIFVGISILLTSLFFYAFAATPSSTFYISSGVYPGAPSYTVWGEGSNYFAKDSNGQIDYSGTDTSQIIMSITDTDGVTIYIKKGTYTIDSTIVIDHKYITIFGDGCGTTTGTVLKMANGADCNMFNLSSATFFTLRDMQLLGDKSNAYGYGIYSGDDGVEATADILIDHVFICKFAKSGVFWKNCWGATIVNSYCEDNVEHGIEIYAWNNLFQTTTFNWNDIDGISLRGTGELGNSAIIDSCPICENNHNGIYIMDGANFVISNNIIRGNGYDGDYDAIHIHTEPKNITITGNLIEGKGCKDHAGTNSRYGIYTSISEVVIDGNTFGTFSTGALGCGGGAHPTIGHNLGFVTENSGTTGAIASGATVNHGLASTPTSVIVTASETGLTDIYVSAVGDTTFVINYAGGGTHVFYWYAEYKP